jgi:ubiquinone/menaquinone biosynthesis C-methylase UbiE
MEEMHWIRAEVSEDKIAGFWEAHPCGAQLAGGVTDLDDEFFSRYDSLRYGEEAHIPAFLDAMHVAGKRVLEIGLGQGADSEQLIRRGAIWSGLDLTNESVTRVRLRMLLRNLPHEAVKVGSVLRIPYESNSFDIVFSHGVLHHVPDIQQAQREIHRVLRPDGKLVVMLYAKYSVNYLLSISLLRRFGLFAIYYLMPNCEGIYGAHVKKAREMGLLRYIRMRNFIHHNTDGPDNPYTKVYSTSAVRRDFSDFRVAKVQKAHMHAPPVNIHGWPGSSLLGWHLWVHLAPR